MKLSSMFKDLSFNEIKPVITTILETEFTKEVRITMYKGSVMKEHHTRYPIIVHVIDGIIEFGVLGKTKHLTSGDLLALEGNVLHNLKANTNSIIRLTLWKWDSKKRL